MVSVLLLQISKLKRRFNLLFFVFVSFFVRFFRFRKKNNLRFPKMTGEARPQLPHMTSRHWKVICGKNVSLKRIFALGDQRSLSR